MNPVRWTLFWATLLASGIGAGEQMQRFGDFEAHYVVFPSTFVQSEIAHQYGLRRGPGLAVNDGAVFRLPVFALFPYVLAGCALGTAEGALDGFVGATRRRIGAYSGTRVAAFA